MFGPKSMAGISCAKAKERVPTGSSSRSNEANRLGGRRGGRIGTVEGGDLNDDDDEGCLGVRFCFYFIIGTQSVTDECKNA